MSATSTQSFGSLIVCFSISASFVANFLYRAIVFVTEDVCNSHICRLTIPCTFFHFGQHYPNRLHIMGPILPLDNTFSLNFMVVNLSKVEFSSLFCIIHFLSLTNVRCWRILSHFKGPGFGQQLKHLEQKDLSMHL